MSPAGRLGPMDLHLIAEGRHEQLWQALGAHLGEADGAAGTWFSVWAPNAREVRVAGDRWSWVPEDGPAMNAIGSGVWEAFVPGIAAGERYKFAIRGPGGQWRLHSDRSPAGRRSPPTPRRGSWRPTSPGAMRSGSPAAARSTRTRAR